MASDAIGQPPVAEDISKSVRDETKHGPLHQDVEMGLEAIDIDRIEKVYRYCPSRNLLSDAGYSWYLQQA